MRQKHKRLVKFMALQERRAMAETARCAKLESKIDDMSNTIAALGGLLESPDPSSAPFIDLVLDRLRLESQRRAEGEVELERLRAEALELKRQIKRVEKLADQVEQKIRTAEAEKEKQTILERVSRGGDVSVE